MESSITTTKAPECIKSIMSEDGYQHVAFFDNGSMTIREFNGEGKASTYICLDASTVQKIILNAQII